MIEPFEEKLKVLHEKCLENHETVVQAQETLGNATLILNVSPLNVSESVSENVSESVSESVSENANVNEMETALADLDLNHSNSQTPIKKGASNKSKSKSVKKLIKQEQQVDQENTLENVEPVKRSTRQSRKTSLMK